MWSKLLTSIKADLYRMDGRQGLGEFLKGFILSPGFRYVVLMRINKFMGTKTALRCTLYPLFLIWYNRLGMKLGIRLPLSCSVGNGLCIEHWGGIWINPATEIGENCNIAQGVTLGWVGKGVNRGAPIIGNQVFLGPGCVVLGRVKIDSYAVISANTVILQDVPESSVVIGVPGRVFSKQGSHDLVKYCHLKKEARAGLEKTPAITR